MEQVIRNAAISHIAALEAAYVTEIINGSSMGDAPCIHSMIPISDMR